MTFTIDTYSLTVTDFTETSQPVSTEWYTWENEQLKTKRFTYALKRVWEIGGIEKDIAWTNSVIKYLQEKMSAGETVTLSASEGDRYSLSQTSVHVERLEFDMTLEGMQNIRRYRMTLKEV